MRTPRFRIRTLMAAVAILATSLGAGVLIDRRSHSFRERAIYHDAAWRQLENECRGFCTFGLREERVAEINRWRHRERALRSEAIEFHRALSTRYQEAATRPWLPIGSEPAPPPRSNPRLYSADEF